MCLLDVFCLAHLKAVKDRQNYGKGTKILQIQEQLPSMVVYSITRSKQGSKAY